MPHRRAMLIFHSQCQRGHAPTREFHNGDWTDFAECPERVDAMLAALGPTAEPDDHGLDAILAVHDADYVEFLRTAHEDWVAAGRTGDAIGYAFPVVRRVKRSHERIDARLGMFGFDASTPIAAGTWDATYQSAQCALSAVAAIERGDVRQAFALSRPPGHHAGSDYRGGYCYLNAAAIAARAAQARGLGRVSILDVDYHHGNGTQDIFYEDGDIFFASIHADPSTDYPFFWGHADERGSGSGKGATLNLPLPRGTGWDAYAPALDRAIAAIEDRGTEMLVVSYGADTFIDDPISFFALTTDDMRRIGARIAATQLPVVAVMEGGYAIEALGRNVAAFIDGLEAKWDSTTRTFSEGDEHALHIAAGRFGSAKRRAFIPTTSCALPCGRARDPLRASSPHLHRFASWTGN
ncbi:histone deacetylase family protein [Sphingomicrobium sp. XHP0239]|uniref:histone deacetylase family protein n=1 Tax=Sphingomicrobium maritimum TaxID=3133972 RepID=UPI0031CCCEEF